MKVLVYNDSIDSEIGIVILVMVVKLRFYI